MRLASLNLNQLVSLDALLAERHVGRAAARMGVTQSAMSHTLRSLRELMNDPLLVRVGNAMVLTPYAEQAQAKLRRGLGDLEAVVSGRAAFDPSTITDTFTFAVHDAAASGLVAPLFRELRSKAPRAKLRLQNLDVDNLVRQLGDGGVDIAFVGTMMPLDALSTMPVGDDGYSVMCRDDHPVIRKRLSLAQYCKVPHAMLSLSGEGPSFIDHLLREQGRSRQVEVRVPYLLSLAEVVASSDLLASVPDVVAEYVCELWPIKRFPLPLELPAGGAVLAWHPRFDADPPHVFFREIVGQVFEWVTREGRPSFRHAAAVKKARGRR